MVNKRKNYRIKDTRTGEVFAFIARATSKARAEQSYAKFALRDPNATTFLEAIELDACFNPAEVCGGCGLPDPHVALGETTCPNCE